ncbi:sporulation membrane protein YtrI [Alkalicoccobacillus plakortidis]|uniref:Sporulation membrane protein YtrI C-terminal domain-containing protein n=1 Tax=Alkalicoccobacillus plakortidis TaxID=444060 RepID=A0ABT0XH70_9BACI|nr:sporulation membrane protein YtrI [Alkalicoccobacillus plakortidis]MCM2675273.1 hypothetical protein [Alkalicoccobacillus plakortidis]
MRVPSNVSRPGWLRFFAGIMLGSILGWVFFLFQYGQIYDGMIVTRIQQDLKIETLQERIDQLISEQKSQNEDNQKKLTIQQIEVHFTSESRLDLDQLTIYEIRQNILSELAYLERKDIESVHHTKELLIRTIENKIFTVEDKRYQVKINEVYLFTTLHLYAEIQLDST